MMSGTLLTGTLRSKVISGLLWSVVQSWGGKLMTLLLFMVLARILDPHDLGVFAAASVVIAFIALFVEQGLSEAIVQRSEVSVAQLNTAFLINLCLAFGLLTALWFASPLVATAMNIPELESILRIAGLGLLVSAVSFTQLGMHRRNFNYRWIAMCSFSATVISGLVGVVLAYLGYGVWSLIVQMLLFTTLSGLLLWLRPQWAFSFDFDFKGTRPLFAYGMQRLGSNLLDFANNRYVEILLATTLGPVALGIYAVGIRVYQALMQALSSAILDVAHNGFSRLANDRPALIQAFYQSVTLTSAVAVPPFLLLATISTEATLALFGEKWIDSAEVMRPMAMLGALQVMQFYNVTSLNAIGRPGIGLNLMILKTVTTVGVLWFARNESLAFIAYTFALCQLVTTIPSFFLVQRVLGVSNMLVLKSVLPFLASAGVATGLVVAIRGWIVQLDTGAWLEMIALTAVWGSCYLCCTLLFARGKVIQTVRFVMNKKHA